VDVVVIVVGRVVGVDRRVAPAVEARSVELAVRDRVGVVAAAAVRLPVGAAGVRDAEVV
jgi:hypothetical protein